VTETHCLLRRTTGWMPGVGPARPHRIPTLSAEPNAASLSPTIRPDWTNHLLLTRWISAATRRDGRFWPTRDLDVSVPPKPGEGIPVWLLSAVGRLRCPARPNRAAYAKHVYLVGIPWTPKRARKSPRHEATMVRGRRGFAGRHGVFVGLAVLNRGDVSRAYERQDQRRESLHPHKGDPALVLQPTICGCPLQRGLLGVPAVGKAPCHDQTLLRKTAAGPRRPPPRCEPGARASARGPRPRAGHGAAQGPDADPLTPTAAVDTATLMTHQRPQRPVAWRLCNPWQDKGNAVAPTTAGPWRRYVRFPDEDAG
jgi:hypothetical protein